MAPEAAGPYHHIEDPPTSTTPLIGAGDRHAGRRRPYVKEISLGISGLLIIGISIGLLTEKRQNPLYKNGDDATLSSWNGPWPPVDAVSISRGKTEGVSEKSNGAFLGTNYGPPYPWTNNMLSWQRTGFHFQPEKNWMN
ncbi:hypothetical protein CRG98_042046, partial [Punica granatum]